MPFNGLQISAPVSFGNVQRALSTGYYTLSRLCRNANVNKFAKYKPIRYAKRGILTNEERQANVSIWTGYVCTWGIKRKVSFDYTQFEVNGDIASDPWVWDMPTGGVTSPFRLTDFVCGDDRTVGYSIKAVAPIDFHFPLDDNLYIPVSGDGTEMSFIFTFNNGVLNWLPQHSLALGDILTTAELQYYPTLIMVCKAGNRVWRYGKSADDRMATILQGNPYAQIFVDTQDIVDVVNAQGGTTSSACFTNDTIWKCCMILSSIKLLGDPTSYEINAGAIARLEYEAGVDTFDMSVVRTEWTDQISGYTVSLVLVKRQGYTPARYYIDSLTIDLSRTGSYQNPMSFYVEVLYTCVGGHMSTGGQQTTVTDGITIPALSGSVTQNYPSQFEGPEFVFAGQSGIPQGVSVAGIGVSLLRNEDRSVYLTANFNIDCSTGQASYTASKQVK